MKKKIILLSIIIINMCNGSDELPVILYTNDHFNTLTEESTQLSSQADVTSQEEFDMAQLESMQEYDQHITDMVIAPPISNTEILFRNVMGSLLMWYIQMREKASYYQEKVKNNCIRLYRGAINIFK